MALSILAISFFCQRSTNAAIAFSFFSAIFSSRTWRFLAAELAPIEGGGFLAVPALAHRVFLKGGGEAGEILARDEHRDDDGDTRDDRQVEEEVPDDPEAGDRHT